jgi:hypothetical protein
MSCSALKKNISAARYSDLNREPYLLWSCGQYRSIMKIDRRENGGIQKE